MQKAEDAVEKLQDALDSDAIEEGRLEALKEHLAEAEEDRATYAGSYEESVIASDKAKELLRTKREQLSEIDLRIEEATTKLNKAKAKLARAEDQRGKALQRKNTAIDSVRAAKDKLTHTESERDDKALVVAHFIEEASKICVRVPVDAGETGTSIDKKLAKLDADVKRFENRLVELCGHLRENQLRKLSRMGGSQEKIVEDAAKAVAAAEQAETQAASMRELAQVKPSLIVHLGNH